MSREILFRGKNIHWDEWHEGDLIQLGEDRKFISTTGPLVQVDPATVGQFTGMRNEGGTKTFEGDILEMEGQPPIRVVYYEGMFLGVPLGVEPRYHGDFIPLVEYLSCGYKVIGNIHDTQGEE